MKQTTVKLDLDQKFIFEEKLTRERLLQVLYVLELVLTRF